MDRKKDNRKKLAELGKLILAGAEKRPQCYSAYFWNERSCALGAACEALTGEINFTPLEVERTLYGAFPSLRHKAPDCPLCGQTGNRVMGLLLHLNDQHRWTRERIAALLIRGLSKKSIEWLFSP